MSDVRRGIPRTDRLLADPALTPAADRLGRPAVKRAVVAAQARARAGEIAPGDVLAEAVAALPPLATSLQPILNATGVVLHTNLGRAPLSQPARVAVLAASGATDVELDLASGRRALRGRGTLAALRAAVPAAGDVHVVNNGAAALLLAITTLCRAGDGRREVVVSRGELVEIGDSFRLPDLLRSTGARLREVGTTNLTRAADYAAAVGPRTGCVLKVHPANFRQTGFTAAAPAAELSGLGVPLVVDTGSGLLRPHPALPAEPDAATALADGATIVTCSADKLLGGPQAGLVLGDAALVARMRRHPIARALRVDKLTLAALEATVSAPPTPTEDALVADPVGLAARARALVVDLRDAGVEAEAVPSDGMVGGGGAPGVVLPGAAVSLPPGFAAPLRLGRPPVLGRLEHGRCLLDLRCVPPADEAVLRDAVLAVHRAAGGADDRRPPDRPRPGRCR